jgi:hypothetical protein
MKQNTLSGDFKLGILNKDLPAIWDNLGVQTVSIIDDRSNGVLKY